MIKPKITCKKNSAADAMKKGNATRWDAYLTALVMSVPFHFKPTRYSTSACVSSAVSGTRGMVVPGF